MMQSNVQKVMRTVVVVGAVIFGLTACDQNDSAQQKIAYVDFSTVLKDSVVGKQEAEHTKKVKERLLSAEKDAEQHYKALPDEQQKQSRQADSVIINRQWLAEQQHARIVSLKTIKEAVEAYRQKNTLTLILDRQQVVAASMDADISKQIIAQLADVSVDYGNLPVISIRSDKSAALKTKESEEAQ